MHTKPFQMGPNAGLVRLPATGARFRFPTDAADRLFPNLLQTCCKRLKTLSFWCMPLRQKKGKPKPAPRRIASCDRVKGFRRSAGEDFHPQDGLWRDVAQSEPMGYCVAGCQFHGCLGRINDNQGSPFPVLSENRSGLRASWAVSRVVP